MIWFILILCGIILFLIKPSSNATPFKHKYYAHRGFHQADQSVKENSILAFQEAVKRGYGIELDVQFSKDNEVVIYHDYNLNRLDDVNSTVRELSLEELRKYQIPTLKEVLELIDGKVELIIELKSIPDYQLLSLKVKELLDQYQGPYCIESFDPRIVAWFKQQAPQIKRGQLIMPGYYYDNKLLGYLINTLFYNFLTKPHFLAIHHKISHVHPFIKVNQWMGVQTVLWTIHQEHKTDYPWVDAIIFEHFEA